MSKKINNQEKVTVRISGTLRRKIDESIQQKVVSKNLLLLLCNYYYHQIVYKTPDEDEVQAYLELLNSVSDLVKKHEGNNAVEYLKAVKVAVDSNYPLSKKHLMTTKQVKQLEGLLNGEYTYISNYIRDVLVKLTGKSGALDKKDLKLYILENDKVEFILSNIGCDHIRYVSNPKGDDYYQCTNPDGGYNEHAVRVYTNEYLNVQDFTRNLGDVADIFTLVQLAKGFDFGHALLYVNQILGLSNLSDEDLRLLSIDTEAKKVERKQYQQKKKESKKQEERRLYREALEKDEKTYNQAEPLLFEDWYKEGICFESVRRMFGIKWYEYDGKYQQIIFPIKEWSTGRVVAYQRRLIYDKSKEQLRLACGQPKYLLTEGYNKNQNLYGLWENYDEIIENRRMIIYESPKSVMKRWVKQDHTAVAIQGKSISWEQAGIINHIAECIYNKDYMRVENGEEGVVYTPLEVVVALDSDVDEYDVRNVCKAIRRHSREHFNISYIYDKRGILKNHESPADTNRKNFDTLLKNRSNYINYRDW